MKILFSILFVLLNGSAQAEWLEIVKISDERYFSIESNKIDYIPNNRVSVWIKRNDSSSNELKSRKRTGSPINGFDEFSHAITKYVIDCTHKQIATSSTTSYSINGDSLESINYKASQLDFTDAVPDSVAEEVIAFSCLLSDSRKKKK